jgi:hypothetical protein
MEDIVTFIDALQGPPGSLSHGPTIQQRQPSLQQTFWVLLAPFSNAHGRSRDLVECSPHLQKCPMRQK